MFIFTHPVFFPTKEAALRESLVQKEETDRSFIKKIETALV